MFTQASRSTFDAIWSKVERCLKTLSTGRTVWFCGHSLGGALATLAAHRYHPKTRGVCTIGCPRVGDRAFVADFDTHLAGKSLRYVNHHDIITEVPLRSTGYEHVAAARFIAADGTVSDNPSRPHDFFEELVGSPELLLETIEGLNKAQGGRVAPNGAAGSHAEGLRHLDVERLHGQPLASAFTNQKHCSVRVPMNDRTGGQSSKIAGRA
jgi:pimeloyl-ACP methyl ester carboxylesterase